MAVLRSISIEGYRSIDEPVDITFPASTPVVLFGENNTGKSNIVRAIDLLLGEMWPSSYKPEDHDFYGRSQDADRKISLTAEIDGFPTKYGDRSVTANLRASARRTDFAIHHGGTFDKVYATAEERAALRGISIGADRRLSYQLSYASKYTWLSKLMRRFHESLKSDPARLVALREQFDALQTIFAGVPEFAAFRKHLRDESASLALALEYGLEVDLSAYDASNFFRSLRMQASQDGEMRSFDEMGTGQEQLLAIAFGYAYAKAFAGTADQLLLIIEEPEAHLHPAAQEWLGSQVLRFAAEGVQVLVTTHSPYFISLERLAGAVRVWREDGTGATQVTQTSPTAFAQHCVSLGAPTVNAQGLLRFYEANATTEIRSGLLSSGVILVEGETEELALPILLRRADEKTYRRGWRVVRCGSKSGIAKWVRLCSAYNIPCHVIVDSDDDPADSVTHLDLCKAMSISTSEIEALMGARGVNSSAMLTVMSKDFESAMRTEYPEYVALEADARETMHLRSKPSIARYVASQLSLASACPAHRISQRLANYRLATPTPFMFMTDPSISADDDPDDEWPPF